MASTRGLEPPTPGLGTAISTRNGLANAEPVVVPSALRCRQRQSVQLAAHPALQGFVDHLVLADPILALEGRRDDGCGVMVAVPSQILHLDPGVRERLP